MTDLSSIQGSVMTPSTRRRALLTLAGSAGGLTEPVLLLHGFTTALIATLIDDGLAQPSDDGRIRITDRGLRTHLPPILTRRERQLRRALALLAGRPHGCTTPVLLDYGIKWELLTDLAEAGLVRMQKQPVIGSHGTEVARVYITAAGRQVLAG
jgi:hypothetical protein